MKYFKTKTLAALFAANVFSALTLGIYYVVCKDNAFFNLSAAIWLVCIVSNMVVCVKIRKSAFLRTIAMIAPPVLFMLSAMLGTNSKSPVMGIIVEVLAFIYFAFSAFHTYYLDSEKYPVVEVKRPKAVGIIFYAIYYVIVTAVFLTYYYFTLIRAELKMSSAISMMSGFSYFLPVLALSVSIGFVRRLELRGNKVASKAVALIAAFSVLGSLIPVAALPNTSENADKAYVKVFGGENEKFVYSVPQMMFGRTESGYVEKRNVTYYVMNYDGKEYELKYDMFKSNGENAPSPVIIRLHGSGGDKGFNLQLIDQSLASEGYTVFDVNYGNEKVKPTNDELAVNVCRLLDYLYENREELNIDVNNIILSGTSRGGKIALKTAVAWTENVLDLKDKVTVKGSVLVWSVMNDVFERDGKERIVSLEELTSDLPPVLFVDTTNDGSVQGGILLEGVLRTLGVKAANVELRYAMHGANNNLYGGWGQLTEYYILRFADDMTR